MWYQEKTKKENITPSNMIRGQNLFLARNLFISRSMAARSPHGALKLQPRDEKDISHWSAKIVSGSKNRFFRLITVRELLRYDRQICKYISLFSLSVQKRMTNVLPLRTQLVI